MRTTACKSQLLERMIDMFKLLITFWAGVWFGAAAVAVLSAGRK